MQIEYPYKDIYKLYALVLPEESKSEFIKTSEELVKSGRHYTNNMFLMI